MVAISPKKLLSDLGVAVTKVASATQTLNAARRDSQGWLVELVGPSGVGKTTLKRKVAPTLQKDWYFEHHAKGLLGHVPESASAAAYLKPLLTARLEDLLSLELPFGEIATASQRVCEVARLGLVSKSPDLPRGFFMDDGLLHFFAGQMLEQERTATENFLQKTAFIFLLPDGENETVAPSPSKPRTQMDVYRDSLKMVREIGCPTLVLNSADRTDHADQVLSFFKQGILSA